MNRTKLFFLAAGLLLLPALSAQTPEQTVPRRISIGSTASIPLIRNGVPCVEIVLPEGASDVTAFAAEELRSILSKSFGGAVPVVRVPSAGKTQIILGDGEFARAAGIRTAEIPRDGFVIRSSGTKIHIAGTDDPNTRVESARNLLSIWANNFERGTLNGVYDFLERFCGVRFYFPGELGTIVPEHRELSVPEMDLFERPDYTVRLYSWHLGEWFDPSPEWGRGGVRAKTLSMYRNRHETIWLPCNHGLLALNYHGRFAKTHPEYFAIINGRRSNLDRHPYLCFNSGITEEIFQDAKAYLQGSRTMADRGGWNEYGRPEWPRWQGKYFDMMPQDGFLLCECPECRKIKQDRPIPGVPDKEISDHVWSVTAKIARRLSAEGIPGTVTQMAYWPYNRVPDFPLPENLLVMVAAAGPWDPANRSGIIGEWAAKLHKKVWLWTYAGKFGAKALPGFPSCTPRAVGKYYPSKRDLIFGAYMESDTDRALYHAMNYYVFGKVMWNNDTDVDALLNEHYRLMYGKAAPVMKKIMERVEDDWLNRLSGEQVENESGVFRQFPSEYKIWNSIYPPETLRRMEMDYTEAEKLAEQPIQKERIRLMKREFLDGLLRQSAEYRDRIRQAEEWIHSVPDAGATDVFLHSVPDGVPAPGRIETSMENGKLQFAVKDVSWKGLSVLLDGRTIPFEGPVLFTERPQKESVPFDLVRGPEGKYTERWNFFLDGETSRPDAFGKLRMGSPDDGNLALNGDFAGKDAAPWLGPLYAKPEAGAHLDGKVFLTAGQSMRLESSGKFSTSFWQNLPNLKPNTRYRITFYVKLENVKPFDSNGGVISTCFDQVNRWYPAGPLTGTMPWTKQCNEIVTGPDTNKKGQSYFNVTLRNASGKAWVDNIRIQEQKDPVKK